PLNLGVHLLVTRASDRVREVAIPVILAALPARGDRVLPARRLQVAPGPGVLLLTGARDDRDFFLLVLVVAVVFEVSARVGFREELRLVRIHTRVRVAAVPPKCARSSRRLANGVLAALARRQVRAEALGLHRAVGESVSIAVVVVVDAAGDVLRTPSFRVGVAVAVVVRGGVAALRLREIGLLADDRGAAVWIGRADLSTDPAPSLQIRVSIGASVPVRVGHLALEVLRGERLVHLAVAVVVQAVADFLHRLTVAHTDDLGRDTPARAISAFAVSSGLGWNRAGVALLERLHVDEARPRVVLAVAELHGGAARELAEVTDVAVAGNRRRIDVVARTGRELDLAGVDATAPVAFLSLSDGE